MKSPSDPATEMLFPIVGIGASAGGLEPLEEIFSHLSSEVEMAIIIIVHSDPSHETLLPTILARRTKFGVHKAKEGSSLKRKCVYVCPSDSILTIEKGKLHLTPRSRYRSPTLPIDQFFYSLAAEFENRAVAVVLSGTGSDGTLGVREIKQKGGITFAQDEKSAKFYSMPQNAVATGAVDFVLPPKDIAQQLEKVARHEYVKSYHKDPASAEVPPFSEKPDVADFKGILSTIHRASGIDFSQYKHGTVSRRVMRRMALHNINSIADFHKFLLANPKVAKEVAQDILIQVTKFFREPEAFELLKMRVFPSLVEKRAREEPIRVWVPGCSSGEEVYSVLMALMEFLEEGGHRFPIQFFGTDLSEVAIGRSRAASYVESIAQDVSPERLKRFFTKSATGYEINKSLRDLCIFAKHNVVTDPPFGKLDLVTCRNLLIYLEVGLQQRALSIFHYALKPNGILILGDAETVGGISDLYSQLDVHHRVYAKKPASSRLFFDFVGAQQTADKISPLGAVTALGESASKGIQMQRDADRYLLAQFVPAGVLVNDQLELVQFRGKTGPFFEPAPGFASLDLLSMLKVGLVGEVKNAIEEARQKKETVRKEDIHVKLNGDLKRIALEVIPMPLPSTGERYFILLLEDMDLPTFNKTKHRREVKNALPPEEETKELSAVRAELLTTKDFLQALKEEKEASNEELRAANEEIVSSNEELQSTNEELHSAKEELQSTNEELLTVNDELKIRNQDLSALNDDLSNLFNSFNSAMILLTKDLRVRRFTPIAGTLFRLLPGDVGRSIADIRPNVEIQDMEKLLLEVIATAIPKTMEVEDTQGNWYSVQMKPYRTQDDRIDGGVLIFTDVTQLKTSLIYSEAVESIYAHPLLVLDGELKVKRANRKFYDVFKVTPRETENRFIYSLGNEQWNIPELRKLLESVLPQSSELTKYEVTHDFPTIGRKTMLVNARRLFYQNSATETILLTIEVTA